MAATAEAGSQAPLLLGAGSPRHAEEMPRSMTQDAAEWQKEEASVDRTPPRRRIVSSEMVMVIPSKQSVGMLFDANACRTFRMRQIIGNTDAGESAEFYRRPRPLPPDKAMTRLLGHVHVDNDGGILNLKNNSVDVDNDEVTKIPMLKKNVFEVFVALFTLMRVALNACSIIWLGEASLIQYFAGESFTELEWASRHWNLHVPLAAFCLAVRVMEMLFVLLMLGTVLWDAMRICLPCAHARAHCAQMTSRERSVGSLHKYRRVVRVWWEIYPELQNFSALRALEYCHPALVAKHAAQAMSARHCAARVVLERFLNVPPETVTDEELIDKACAVLLAADFADRDEQARYDRASQCLLSTPTKIAHQLFESPGLAKMRSGEASRNMDIDLGALSLWWRLALYTGLLGLRFGVLLVLSASIGGLAFVVKLSFVSNSLNNPNVTALQSCAAMFVFLNQLVGIVSLRSLLVARVRAFAFGGTDAQISAEEQYLLDMYLVLLAEKIWASSKISCFQKVAVMAQFDDADLQQLMVEEDPVVKSDVVLSVKRYMHETGVARPSWVLQWLHGRRRIPTDGQLV